jgi:ribosome-associated toxin RatA of RatAB toxin-antitoxin module
MNRKHILTFLVISIAIAILMSGLAHAKLPSVEERLESGGIIKDVIIPGDGMIAYVTVQTLVDAPPAAVWSALKDIEEWPRWLPMSSNAHFVSKEAEALITPEIAKDRKKVTEIDAAHPNTEGGNGGEGSWQRLALEEYDLPWPLENQWVIRRYTYEENDDLMKASWRKIDGSSQGDDGYWKIKPWKDGKTELKYYYIVKVKGPAPKPLFTAAINLTVNSMIKALRREAKLRSSQIVTSDQ